MGAHRATTGVQMQTMQMSCRGIGFDCWNQCQIVVTKQIDWMERCGATHQSGLREGSKIQNTILKNAYRAIGMELEWEICK